MRDEHLCYQVGAHIQSSRPPYGSDRDLSQYAAVHNASEAIQGKEGEDAESAFRATHRIDCSGCEYANRISEDKMHTL